MLSVISFNVNSIRQRLHQLQAVIETYAPDFIGLQETKVTDEDFPKEAIEALGYHVHYHGQKTHYGVALLSKQPFLSTFKGYQSDDEQTQRRLIGGRFDSPFGGEITVINGYFPQGERREHPLKFPNKQKFYADLLQLLQQHYQPTQQLIVMGDMNIAPEDSDIGIGEDNRQRWLRTGKCSFLPEERQWLARLQDWGLIDTFKHGKPEEEQRYSWFDYRSGGFTREPKRGLRIDLILASKVLAERVQKAGIDYRIRAMEKSSDHCPVWTCFSD
ncbi:MAG: exodeoxyribonuclease III [Cellvibrionaceae bacterium]|nr:exodeoxyribonuclease III [Cellvibrionaceae bacterium]